MKSLTVINQHVTYLTIDIIRKLCQNGWQVRLITGCVDVGSNALPESVKKVNSMRYIRSNTILRMLTWSIFFFINSIRLLFIRDDLLIITNPPFMPFILPFYKRLTGKNVYLLVFDIYPEALSRFGIMSSSSWIYKLWERCNKSIYQQANEIFTLSTSMTGEIKKYLSANSHIRINTVLPWKDGNHIAPLEKNKNVFLKAHSLENKFIVLYSGNMGLTHDMDTIIQSAIQLQDSPDIHFVLIGGGSRKKELIKMSKDSRLNNISFFDWQPVSQLPFTFAAADLAVVSQSAGIESLSIPSKTCSYLSVGAPIVAITADASELGRIITANECGRVVNPGDVNGFSKYIHELYMNPKALGKYKMNSLKAANQFTTENAEKLVERIESR